MASGIGPMSTLIVILPLQSADAHTAYDYMLSPDGASAGPHATAPAHLLPAPGGATGEIVAVVPAQAISWHRVALPKGTLSRSMFGGASQAPRLRAVLEGLLEDRLLDETADLHFALAPDAGDGAPSWVAVCDRRWLRNALQPLEDAGRPAGRIVPECSPGADAPALQALGTPELPVLLAHSDDGVSLLPLSAHSLDLARELHGLAADTPLAAEPAVAAQAERELGHPVVLRQATQRWLDAAASRWDLAQFEFVSSSRARAWKNIATRLREAWAAPRWRPARIGVAALVVVQLLGINAWAWKERAALTDKREAIRQTLTQTFPEVKVVVDAPVQMERALAQLRQNSGASSGRDLEALLSATGRAASVGAAGAPAPTGLDYGAGELRLRGMALPDEQTSALREQLRSLGYSLRSDGDRLVVQLEAAP
jgi:general secretion pathway protein L